MWTPCLLGRLEKPFKRYLYDANTLLEIDLDADFVGKTDSLESAASDPQVIQERPQFPQIPPVFLARFSQEVGNAVAELLAADSGASAVSNNPRTLDSTAGAAIDSTVDFVA